jgi:hypothetical protein
LVYFFFYRDRLPEAYRSKNYRTSVCITKYNWNFVRIYGFKNETELQVLCWTPVIFNFFRKYSYSGKWYELHGNFQKFCENFNYGLFRYRKPEAYIYCVQNIGNLVKIFQEVSFLKPFNTSYLKNEP